MVPTLQEVPPLTPVSNEYFHPEETQVGTSLVPRTSPSKSSLWLPLSAPFPVCLHSLSCQDPEEGERAWCRWCQDLNKSMFGASLATQHLCYVLGSYCTCCCWPVALWGWQLLPGTCGLLKTWCPICIQKKKARILKSFR